MNSANSLDGTSLVPLSGRVAAPLREQVISTLRAAILDQQFEPGQRLVERELIERLGVSRTTIREALRDLISEGLVTVVPQRGAVVSAPTREEAADLYEIRAVIESLVVRHFVQNVGDEEIAQLARSVDELEAVVESDPDVREILAAKDRFYAILVEGARNPTLQRLLEGLKARVQLLRATSLTEPGRPQQVVAELRAVSDAVGRRDSALASRLCADHVRLAATAAMRVLSAADADA